MHIHAYTSIYIYMTIFLLKYCLTVIVFILTYRVYDQGNFIRMRKGPRESRD